MGKAFDWRGMTCGAYVVLRRVDNCTGHVMWECQCRTCGRLRTLASDKLRHPPRCRCGAGIPAKDRAEYREPAEPRKRVSADDRPTMGCRLDLTGQSFGMLEVIGRAKAGTGHARQWDCRCKCGGSAIYTTTRLLSGKVLDCGCARKDKYARVQPGAVFGALRVESVVWESGHKKASCVCECGNSVTLPARELAYGHRMTCGCGKRVFLDNVQATCGLSLRLVGELGKGSVDAEFEDGVHVQTSRKAFLRGAVAHPALSRKDGQFHGFVIHGRAYVLSDGSAYYFVSRPDGADDILTPRQMLALAEQWAD